MGKTIYTIGFFALAIVLWLEPIIHMNKPWQLKTGVRSVIFLAYVLIGMYFDLIQVTKNRRPIPKQPAVFLGKYIS